jgi:hypothetical protein
MTPNRVGLVLGDIAALQDKSADGKQKQEDKNGVEFGAEKSTDHEQFSQFCAVLSLP